MSRRNCPRQEVGEDRRRGDESGGLLGIVLHRHLSSAQRAGTHLEAADDSSTVEKSVVATRLLPVVELLLLEIVDADGLAEEVAWTLGHDPGKRTGASPPASVGDVQILGLRNRRLLRLYDPGV